MARRTTTPFGNVRDGVQSNIRIVKNDSIWHRFVTFLQSDNFIFIVGLLLFVLATYLLLAYISFFHTGRTDFSILELPSDERQAIRTQITNITGLPGAVITYVFVNSFCGLPIIIIYLLTFVMALQCMGIVRVNIWRWTFICIFMMLWFSCVMALLQYVTTFSLFYRLGGAMGDSIIIWGVSYIHIIGTVFCLFTVLVIFGVCIDNRTILWFKKSGTIIKDWLRGLVIKIRCWYVEYHTKRQLKRAITRQQHRNMRSIGTPQSTIVTPPIITDVPKEQQSGVTFTIENEATGVVEDATIVEESTDDDLLPMENRLKTPDLTINHPKDIETMDQIENSFPDPKEELANYQFPTLELLKTYDNENSPIINKEEQQANANRIVETLHNYGVEIETIKATVGPTVTLYEVVPKAGVKISKIQNLENDIMLSLAAIGIRIIAPMPGKGTVGIEVPNEKPQIVSMHSVLASKRFQEESKMKLPVAIGRTITNEVFMFDLAKTPHLLVAGATGQGKSVGLNAIITSLLYKKHPAELKFVLVDPKMVEFSIYKPLLKHYMAAMPDQNDNDIIITDCQKVINTLNSLVIEMENRYTLLMDAGVRNVEEYNTKILSQDHPLNANTPIPSNVSKEPLHHHFMPYLVIIIDEYGDFIMQAGKEVERPIQRIAQKARAVGMHMILATQRPDVKIVTGTIKANIPTRIAFRTQSVIDSRTVLDTKGADQLVGKGDMLYSGGGNMERIQCAFVDTPEIERIVTFINHQDGYPEPFQLPEYVGENSEDGIKKDTTDIKKLDELFEEVGRYIVANNEGSISKVQRKYEIGFNRAGRLIDQLERTGVVGPSNGIKPREVLMVEEQFNTLIDRLHEQGKL